MKKHKTLFAAMCASLLLGGCGRSVPDRVTFVMAYDEIKINWAEHSLYVFDSGTGYYINERDDSKSIEEQIADTLASCDEDWDCSGIFKWAADTAYNFDFGAKDVSRYIYTASNIGWEDMSRTYRYYVLVSRDGETELVEIGERGLTVGDGNISSDIDEMESICRRIDDMADIHNREY